MTRHLLRERLTSVLYVLLDVPLNVVNYLFVILLSRSLAPADYGQASALLALIGILITPGVALQMTLAKNTAQHPDRRLIPSISVYGMGGSWLSVLVVLAPVGAYLLRTSTGAMLAIGGIVALHLCLAWFRGLVQGQERFLILNGSMYAEMGVKIIALVLLIPLWNAPTSVLIFVGMAYSASLVWGWLTRRRGGDDPSLPLGLKRDFASFLLMQFFIQASLSFDIIAVNYRQPTIAGYYAAAARCGQILVYIMLSLQVVLLPAFSRGGSSDRVRQMMLAWAAFSGVVLFGYTFIAPLIVPLFFGADYVLITPYLPLVALTYLLLGAVNLLSLWMVARQIRQVGIVMLMTPLILLIAYLSLDLTLETVFAAQSMVYLFALIGLLALIVRRQSAANPIQKRRS